MKVSIIGGSGFIGSRFCQQLDRRNRFLFTIIDKEISRSFPQKVKIADVRSHSDMTASVEEGSVIVNLAAEHRDDVRPRSLYDEVNVKGAQNVCKAAKEKEVKTIIFTSTVAVYGFAPVGTDESGEIAPFNDYGRTKHEAELIYREWQAERPQERTLVIVRPTVVFGEGNRGNVYNLIQKIASGRFVMVGDGKNSKSMAYVENVAAFLEHSLKFQPGVHVYNYIDKPDFTMNELVANIRRILGRQSGSDLGLPYFVGRAIGKGFDVASRVTGHQFSVSSIRIEKFCSNTVFNSRVDETGFESPISPLEALERTVKHEFC